MAFTLLMNVLDESMIQYYKNHNLREDSVKNDVVELFSPETFTLKQGETRILRLKIKTRMKSDTGKYVSYNIFPMSGNGNAKSLAMNSYTIDSEYTDELYIEVKAIHGLFLKSRYCFDDTIPCIIEKGDCIAQIMYFDRDIDKQIASKLSIEFVDTLHTN